MSRRSFLSWLLVVAASLLGLSSGIFKLFLNHSNAEKNTAVNVSLNPSDTDLAVTHISSPSEAIIGEPLLSYFILSDLHVIAGNEQTPRKFKQALEDIHGFKDKVEAVLLTGDLTDSGLERDYKEVRKIMNGYKFPNVHANMGNHEYYTVWMNDKNVWSQKTAPNGKTNEHSREQFLNFFGYQKPYNELTVNGYTVLLMSQETYVQEKAEVGEGAWYSDEQMKWLKDRLAAVYEPGKPIFIMTHQPLPPSGQDGGSHQLIRAMEFRSILEPYKNIFVFCGHRHMDFQNGSPHYVKESFHYFHNSSVGRPLNRNSQQVEKNKSQGLYVQVYADKIVLKGREFSNRTFIQEANWTINLQAVKV
jgi:Icc protein